jgi:uracil phosphoribosyltransferase
MQVTNVDHPLVTERLTRLRDKTTKRAEFRRNLEELTAFLVYEAMRNYPVVPIEIDTPMAPTRGVQVAEPPLVVPVMRAGLGMLHATLDVVPNARVGFIGLKRDEETFLPHAYVNTVPENLDGKRVLVLDPMLATGGSGVAAVGALREAGARRIRFLCIVSAPEGVQRMLQAHPDVHIYTAALDRQLNEHGYILPGLGDAGDRLFGTRSKE